MYSGMKYRQKIVLLKTAIIFTLVSVVLWAGFSFLTYFTPKQEVNHKSLIKSRDLIKEKSLFNSSYIKKQMFKLNMEEKILNEKQFGPLKNDSLVIIVQVHNRIEYLKYLISSLRLARGIEDVLLVFSHDHYDENIINLVIDIEFCKVMQMFYPFSLQIYPNEYPGNDPRDCPFGTPKHEAKEKSCWNVLFTDVRNRYRNPVWVQMKLHWWWKANKLFSLEVMRKHDGLVLFLEEDMYLLEDFIHAINLMKRTANSLCPNCKILSLSTNEDAIKIDQADFDTLDQAVVTSQFNNMGFVLTRSTWIEIIKCAGYFCTFDEYNFDFALQHVFTSCLTDAAAMTLHSPRLVHLGTCGVHFSTDDCDPSEVIMVIYHILERFRQKLFPKNMVLIDKKDYTRADTPYGGFADPRDQALCLGITIK